ncbi:unnamed protein product [Dovyalis caffra]|uniref:Pentatricopeptide repeat-containing protein n=1 Tax=Dovyalis caffra TaxID=77055 RepID=A0AAV1QTQ2_9ROSI|nr:unnamed protein product [Dovyalis caffra]
MARLLLSKLAPNKLVKPNSLRFSLPLSTAVSTENPQNATAADGRDHRINDQIHDLGVLLQQGRNETAYNFTKSLILSNPSPFSSPSHLLSLFSVSSDPSSKLTLCDMLLSICSESKMHSQISELYDMMRQEGRLPSFGYVRMIVESLVESKKFDKVLDLFKEMVGLGFRPDKLVYGKAMQAAVKLGDLKRAMELFETMKGRKVSPNVFVYNVLIGGLCKDKRIRDAEKLFDEMSVRNLVPNRVTFNTLIDGYCKAGEVDVAISLRERMKKEKVEPSIITFNSLLSGLCKARRMEEARSMLKEMEVDGFVPDGFTYSIIFDGLLKSNDGAGAAMDLYREAIGKGVRINSYTCSILLNGLCKEGQVEKAEEVLKSLVEYGLVPDEVIYNTIVNGYCQIGDMDRAILTIERMESHGLRPNCITFNSVIDKFCEMQMMDTAEEWVKKMVKKGIAPSVETYNTLIDGYGRLCRFSSCFQILEDMEENGVNPNVISYGSLINCLCKDGKILEAEMVLRDMVGRGVLPNANIYNMLIDGSCTVGKLKEALRFFDEMSKSEIHPTIVTYNALINGLCKKGKLKDAEEMLFLITTRGHYPDVITYNSLISGYSNAGNSQKCLELYETMKKLGLKPTINTYHLLISGCSKEGMELKETLFNEMLQINLSPDRVVYNAMIHFYQEIGHVQKAFALRQEMVDKGVRPDNMTYNSLILGCLKEGKLLETKDLVDDMKAKGLTPEADTYSMLIKGHCDLKDFNGAYFWYREMLENGFLPNVCICNDLSTGLRQRGRLQEAQIICSEMIANGMDDLNTNGELSGVAKITTAPMLINYEMPAVEMCRRSCLVVAVPNSLKQPFLPTSFSFANLVFNFSSVARQLMIAFPLGIPVPMRLSSYDTAFLSFFPLPPLIEWLLCFFLGLHPVSDGLAVHLFGYFSGAAPLISTALEAGRVYEISDFYAMPNLLELLLLATACCVTGELNNLHWKQLGKTDLQSLTRGFTGSLSYDYFTFPMPETPMNFAQLFSIIILGQSRPTMCLSSIGLLSIHQKQIAVVIVVSVESGLHSYFEQEIFRPCIARDRTF